MVYCFISSEGLSSGFGRLRLDKPEMFLSLGGFFWQKLIRIDLNALTMQRLLCFIWFLIFFFGCPWLIGLGSFTHNLMLIFNSKLR
jgi:hypothetical protein